MPNLCQPCGRSHVSDETARIIWLNAFQDNEIYFEWDAECYNGCGNKREHFLHNAKTGEDLVLTLNEFSALLNDKPVDLKYARLTALYWPWIHPEPADTGISPEEFKAELTKAHKRYLRQQAENERQYLIERVLAPANLEKAH